MLKVVNIQQLLKDILDNRESQRKFTFRLLRNDILSDLIDKTNNPDYKRRYRNTEIVKIKLIEQYNEINKKKRKIFSPGTFVGEQGKINCAIISRYVIEEVLGWGFSKAVQEITYKKLYSYHLRSVKQCFPNLYELMNFAYPERNLKPYYFKKHKDVWFDQDGNMKEDLVREAIREFVDVLTNPIGKYKYKKKNLPKWISYKLFQKPVLPYRCNLSYMLNKCFDNSPIDAIIFAYPELNLKPYYFKHVPKGYWSGEKGKEHAREIMQELIENLTDPEGKYKFSKQEVLEIFKYDTYHKPLLPYGKKLGGMLQSLFNNSPSKPLELLDDFCRGVCETCEKENKETCIHRPLRIANFAD